MEAPLLTLLLHLLAAQATQVEGTKVPCPDGSGDTVVHRVVAQNSHGGWDSDGARYSTGGQFRTYEVSTCPSGLSLLAADMGVGLPPSAMQKLEPLLPKLRAERPGIRLEEAPPHDKHAMAARTYEALGRHDTAAQLWMSASWLARDEAVGLFTGVNGPVVARIILEGGDGELAKDLPAAVRKQVTFNLAVVAHRAGYPDRRDRYLAKVQRLNLTPEERQRVARLERWAKMEANYQAKAANALGTAAETATGPTRWAMLYQLGEVARRRGDTRSARSFYALVQHGGDAPAALKQLAEYFVAEIDGKKPWNEERFQTLPGFETNPKPPR